MPVPVPLRTKPPAHPVIKPCVESAASRSIPSALFQHVTNTLPLPPRGPPPSLASREEWINSLPDWRRNKTRRIWEDDTSQLYSHSPSGFQTGLTVADNAMVIKGAPAQACIPPVSILLASANSQFPSTYMPSYYSMSDEEQDDEMSPRDHIMAWQSDSDNTPSDISDISEGNLSPSTGHPSDTARPQCHSHFGNSIYPPHTRADTDRSRHPSVPRRSVFSPLYEEASPELAVANDPASSPVGPATPFAEYVDRAAADASTYDAGTGAPEVQPASYGYLQHCCDPQCYQCRPYPSIEPAAQPAPVPDPVVTPCATSAYKRLAEPISEWVANFVWKVCTTGMDLRPDYAQPSAFLRQYSALPPSHLAKSTHSMLLSTLLQPSAIFLALWYIVKLPVFFGPTCLSQEHVREIRFRTELLGEAHTTVDREAIESYAPFRLVLLGCMLANKWLDDHTFSNKTWHTISNVPIRSLNKLESLALDLLAHDLTIQTDEWTSWLSHLLQYQISLSSPAFPQPIGRPSNSPHTIVRRSLETVMEASNMPDVIVASAAPPTPVFVDLEGQQREKWRREQASEDTDVLEIDLDEDGPLREEYMPKRRISGASNVNKNQHQERLSDAGKMLPPPARWSPEADEPITRDQLRFQHTFALVPRPISQMPAQPPPPPPPFHQALEISRRIWPVEGYAPKLESAPRNLYYPIPPFIVPSRQPTYATYDYPYVGPTPQSHTRSQSASYTQPMMGQSHGHTRSYSQTRYDSGYGDSRIPEAYYQHGTLTTQWSQFHHPGYPYGYEATEYYPQRTSLKV